MKENKYHRKLFGNRIFKVLTCILLFLVIGMLWQNIMLYYESKEYNIQGQLIDVNNHKMHIFGTGNGSPTVVLTVGSGTPCAYTDYYFIQQEISKTVRTISYDRPGYGLSEPISTPRTVDEQAIDLHQLLNNAGEKPPYILVGHSLSSLEVIRYSQLFPKEVCGILLIDGGNPTYYANYNESGAVILSYFLESLRKCGIVRGLGSIGILTPIVGEDKRYKLLPKEIKQIDKMMFYKNLGNMTNRSEIRNINENAKKVIDNGKLGDIPLIILTSKGGLDWEKTQKELKDWSSNNKQEVVIGATHYIHWDKPNIVIDRIQELINNTNDRTISKD